MLHVVVALSTDGREDSLADADVHEGDSGCIFRFDDICVSSGRRTTVEVLQNSESKFLETWLNIP